MSPTFDTNGQSGYGILQEYFLPQIDVTPNSSYDWVVGTRHYFDEIYWPTLKTFVDECSGIYEYEVADGECYCVYVTWVTENELLATVVVSLDDDGYEINSLVGKQPVTIGRKRSWHTSPRQFKRRMSAIRHQLETFVRPPA